MRSLHVRPGGVRLGSKEGRRGVLRVSQLVAATVAAVAGVLLLPLGAAAAQKEVELEGRLSVAVSENPSGHQMQYFLRRGLRLYELDLNERQRRSLEPNQRISVRGEREGARIDVDQLSAGAAPAALTVTGSRSVLVLRVFWASQDAVSQADAVNQVAVVDDDFYRENSYNQLGLTASATRWLQIPRPGNCDDLSAINNSAQTAAADAGYDTAPFEHNMIYISSADCVGRNWGEIGGRITWIQGTMNTYRTAHELGHNFGLGHAHSKSCTDSAGTAVALGSTCTSDEYGDRWDVMGFVPPGFSENSPSHISAPQKDALGWLTGRSLATDSGTHTLTPFEDRSAGLKAIRVTGAGADLWLEYRQALGVDGPLASFPGITGGVLVHETEPTTGSWLLDMTPGSSGGFSDAALPVGATWTSPTGTTVRVNSANAIGASVTLGVSRCVEIERQIAANEAEIRALQEELRTAPPGEKPAIIRAIRALQAENRQLAAEARSLGCP